MVAIMNIGDCMKIEKVKKTKSGKYKITFDNKETLSTYDDVILNNGILFKKEIDSDILDKLNIETGYYEIYNKTVNFISRKLRSEKEVKLFLDKTAASSSDKQKIIKKLKEIGLINDKLFASAYVQDRFNLSTDGPYKIASDLRKNDIGDEVINEYISKIDDKDIYEKLSKLIVKKINSNHNKSNYQLKQKIVNEMINLGYSKDMIIEILDDNLKNNSSVINSEYNKLYRKLSNKYDDEELERHIRNKLFQKGFSSDEINSIEK